MICRIIAGAPEAYIDHTDGLIIAADKGVEHALNHGLHIDVAVGDFDSVNKDLLEGLDHLIKLSPEKDETDLLVAVEYALSKNPDKIIIHGATNGRFDHYIANINLLGLGNIEIIDEINRIFVASKSFLLKTDDYVSFFNYDGEPVISLEGFKYPLKDYELKRRDSLCVSNEINHNEGRVTIKDGRVLVIISKK